MNSTQSPPNVDAVIAEFLKAVEAGDIPTKDQILAEHPTFANELQEFFEDKERIDLLASPQVPNRLDPDSTDQFFGDYELLEEIARGGMGAVFKARQIGLDRIVALKMILTGSLASEAEVQRFQIEAEAAAKLDHSGIVPIYEIGQHNGQHYFSMAYINGPSLAEYLSNGPIPPRQAAEWIQSLSKAVAFAHEAGVIHRDLKPGNILLSPEDGESSSRQHAQYAPKISDFGLAKKSEAECSLTQTGQIIGTPNYMAPEQISGGSVGVTSDLYSLGSILYTMLTGQPPFRASNQIETMNQVVEREPSSTKLLNNAVPKELDTICMKLLAKQPEHRYQSGLELANEIQLWLDGKPIKAKPVGNLYRMAKWCKRNPIVSTLLAITLIAMIVSFSAFLKTSEALASSESHLYEKQILLAAAELNSGHRNQALWTLKATQPEKRGWEYHHLMDRCYPRQSSFVEKSVQICFASQQPRGIQRDGTVVNLETDEIVHRHKQFELILGKNEQFPSPGQYAIGHAPNEPRRIKVVDLLKNRIQGEIHLSNQSYEHLLVTPDGDKLIVISQIDSDSTWTVWSLSRGKQVASFSQEWSVIERLSFEKSQVLLRSLENSTEYLVAYDLVSGEKRFKTESANVTIHRFFRDRLILRHRDGVPAPQSICVSPSGTHLLADPSFRAGPVAVSSDGAYLAVVLKPISLRRILPEKAILQIWRCSDWVKVGKPLSIDGTINLPTFSPLKNQIFCTVRESLDRPSLIAWDWEAGKINSVFNALPPADGRPMSPHYGQLLIETSNTTSPKVCALSWMELGSQNIWFVWQIGLNGVYKLAIDSQPSRVLFSDDGQSVSLVKNDGSIDSSYRIENGVLEESIRNETLEKELLEKYRLRHPVSLADGSGELEIRFPSPDGQNELVFRPPAQMPMLGVLNNGELTIRSNERGDRALEGHVGILTAFAFSKDSRFLATASTSETSTSKLNLVGAMTNGNSEELQKSAEIKIWHVRSGRLIHTMRGHTGIVSDIVFSPDGKRLASTGTQELGSTVDKLRGGQVILWEVGSGRKLLVLPGSQGDFSCVDFSPDGTKLVAAGSQLYLWSGESLRNTSASQPYHAELEKRNDSKDVLISPNKKRYVLKESDLSTTTFERLDQLPAIDQIIISLQSHSAINPPVQFPRPLNNLESLSLFKIASRRSLESIRNSKNLKSLKLLGGISSDGLTVLMNCDSLRELEISLQTKQQLEQLLHHKNLTSLSTNFLNPTPTPMSVSDEAATRLKRLKLQIFRDAECDLSWISGLEQLQSLSIDAKKKKEQNSNTPNKVLDWNFCKSLDSLTDLSLSSYSVTLDEVKTLLGLNGLERINIRVERKLMIQLEDLQELEIPENLLELQLPFYVVEGPNRIPVPKTVVLKCLREKCSRATLHFLDSTWTPQ